ncbi:hypothetical protein, unlikely [Trypanosoma brucei gambiense DAL972]|uniref:Uncharacterized protein n=1 Tax=Trypanosoma brucei gambiense (strain MHOM/CI/86/DAL972) TaxID=679716 RepID=C9ZS52_TRYB9|nr:hypothetical protein, unlikely [Trypanosoma brucei gambiense DAL972]CBH12188.1 hypothetical protein, unlikely [Trypanosoma brucei gambiense DAL972]|eukprot:XP_011774471.1 hypothetical protein, unlikely [Trypanosoma brucei gambiense DAL972]
MNLMDMKLNSSANTNKLWKYKGRNATFKYFTHTHTHTHKFKVTGGVLKVYLLFSVKRAAITWRLNPHNSIHYHHNNTHRVVIVVVLLLRYVLTSASICHHTL